MQMQGDRLTIRQLCETAGISRATYYRSWRRKQPAEEQTALRDAIQRLALKDRHYGYRRIHVLLKREGWMVNHKRVLRLMRQDNLLSIRRRRFVVTTDSVHAWHIYPNLARFLVLTGINQLWVADITYIRLQREFIYLAVILDVYSRRVVGWSLGRQLDSSLAQDALTMALRERRPPPGLVHHSDRGVQYACHDYVHTLHSHGIVASMSRPGNPYDNAWAESFMKTLKSEEVYGQQYRNFDHAVASIESFLQDVYNQRRLHSALAYCSPAEFEEQRAMAREPISTKKEKRSKKERNPRKGRPVETATAVEIEKRLPSAASS